jgi:hypothetical protein
LCLGRRVLSGALAAGALLCVPVGLHAQPVSGAVFTTDSTCSGVDLNIYTAKTDVYLNGGPAFQGAASLPDGGYYLRVTAPDGTPLGSSVGTGTPTPISVSNGTFSPCLQICSAVVSAAYRTVGYDDTPNAGGEYKVWVSQDATFSNNTTKTDNFKVRTSGASPAALTVRKFYDANLNGVQDL